MDEKQTVCIIMYNNNNLLNAYKIFHCRMEKLLLK